MVLIVSVSQWSCQWLSATAALPLELGDSDSDLDIGAASGAGVEGDNPSTLEQWRRHPNYPIGMRIAQLSTFWITNGLPCERFPLFLSWLHAQCPGLVGNINHSFHFLMSSLAQWAAH